jgi:hypothetical protein
VRCDVIVEQHRLTPHRVVLRGGEHMVVSRERRRPPLTQTPGTDPPTRLGLVSPEEQELHPLAAVERRAQISDVAYRCSHGCECPLPGPPRRLTSVAALPVRGRAPQPQCPRTSWLRAAVP